MAQNRSRTLASDDGRSTGPGDPHSTSVELASGNTPRAFGGSILAGMVTGSEQVASPVGTVHSLHAQFVNPGRTDIPADVSARPLRHSRSFTTLDVRLVQQDTLVGVGVVSFHARRPSARHAAEPSYPGRDWGCSPPAHGGPLPPVDAPSRAGFDLRDAGAGRPVREGPDGRPVFQYWVRARQSPRGPNEGAAQLAWISDLCLTYAADFEHTSADGERRAASLDHAMWFHRETDPSQWHLYEVDSPVYESGLALSTGRFFDPSGALVASVAQQSMLRRLQPQQPSLGDDRD